MVTEMVLNPARFQTFFSELEARKSLLTTITDLHKTLNNHFTSLQKSLSQKSQTLDSRIRELDASTKNALVSLQNREDGIPERQSALATRVEEQKGLAVAEIETSGSSEKTEDRNLSETLKMYCRRMDSTGLLTCLLAKRRESGALKAEIKAAVDEAVDSMRLVLDAVEEFVEMKIGKKAGMADRRWACGMLIQSAVPVAAAGVGRKLKEAAVGVLEKWKGVLAGGEGSGGVGAGEVTMFLQMVIGFGLKENFEEDFLKKLVVEFSGRRDMPKLAAALGFGDKMADIIEELVKSGKEIEAIYFASESRLTERFSRVALLKSCLSDCRKRANKTSKSGNHSATAVEKATTIELETTKAIIKCVEDHKLESEFGIESLKKRVSQLEKSKSDKRKNATFPTKPPNRRAYGGSGSKGGGGGPSSSGRPSKSGRFSNASPSFRQRNRSRQVPGPRFSAPYGYPSPAAPFHAQSPAPQFPYAHPEVGPSYGGQDPSYGGQTNYASYDYNAAGAGGGGGAAPPSYPP